MSWGRNSCQSRQEHRFCCIVFEMLAASTLLFWCSFLVSYTEVKSGKAGTVSASSLFVASGILGELLNMSLLDPDRQTRYVSQILDSSLHELDACFAYVALGTTQLLLVKCRCCHR